MKQILNAYAGICMVALLALTFSCQEEKIELNEAEQATPPRASH